MTPRISPRTVVEALLPPTGGVPLAHVYDTASLAGLADQPVRLAIRRLIAQGDVEQAGRGRAGALALTDAGRRRLEQDRQSLALAFAQDAGDAPWDGRWRLMATTIPESKRSLRDAVRRALHEFGAAAISTSLYVSPHDLVDVLPGAVGPYLSTATSPDLVLRGTGSPTAIAETLWPRGPIIDGYEALHETVRDIVLRSESPDVVRLLLLADALELAIRHDPLIPLELRDGYWHPTRIRAAWAEAWNSLSADAHGIFRGWVTPDA